MIKIELISILYLYFSIFVEKYKIGKNMSFGRNNNITLFYYFHTVDIFSLILDVMLLVISLLRCISREVFYKNFENIPFFCAYQLSKLFTLFIS